MLDVGAGTRRRGGIGVQPELHQRALPWVGSLQPRDCVAKTLALVGSKASGALLPQTHGGSLPNARVPSVDSLKDPICRCRLQRRRSDKGVKSGWRSTGPSAALAVAPAAYG